MICGRFDEDGTGLMFTNTKIRNEKFYYAWRPVYDILGDRITGKGELTMAEKKKKVTGKTPPKFQPKRRKTFSEKVFVALGIIIALSMIVSLIVNFIPKAGF